MKKIMFLSLAFCTFIAAAAMAAEAPAKPAVVPAAVEKVAPAIPPGHSGLPAAATTTTPATAAEPAAPPPLAGKVIETMNAGGYSYIYIERADGKKSWVAVAQTPVTVGAQMTFKPGTEMGKFESKSLNKTFDSIIFSDGVLSGTVPDPGKGQGTSPGSGGVVVAKTGKISVTKATGANAYTVEGAIKNVAKLNKKKVVIRGQVVKVSSGIMGKNWIHIQDGSGSEAKKTQKLVCTSATDSANVGDVVTVTGTLIKDRDFGSGYKYAVILEDTKVTK